MSVLFADMVGYTAIVETLGAEKTVPFTRMIYDRLSTIVRQHGGALRGFAGDSIMAVFGIPDVQEDAALRACRAAQSILTTFAESGDAIEARFGVRPQMRVGVSSGIAVMAPVEGDDGPPTAVGNAVNLASRVQSLAPAGGCLICDATRRLVEWLVDAVFDGEHAIKGVTRPQKLWRMVSVRAGATRFDASVARGLSHYTGRDEELATLSAALDRSRDGRAVVDLVAEPGLGKTRLVFEFLNSEAAADCLVLRGHCSTDGQQVPFLPFLEVMRGSFHIREDDEPAEIARKLEGGLRRFDLFSTENLGLLLNLLGLPAPEGALARLDGVLIGLRTRDLLPALLRGLCETTRVVLLVEDIHWIDGASEDLMRRLIEGETHGNLLIVHTRRPEYDPPWREAAPVHRLALRPLDAHHIGQIARRRLGVEALPDGLVEQLTERAGGNPLFGEELLSFLIEQGVLRIENGVADFDSHGGQTGLPVTMQSLLAARIDRLPPADRALLQAAAVIGKRFDPGLLALVVENGEQTGEILRRLQTIDIVYREPDSSDYIFKHVLLRDSVYQALVEQRRTALHLAVARAVERRTATRLVEAAETLAYHYAQTEETALAFRYDTLAGIKSLGVFSLAEAERYFAAALALYQGDPAAIDGDALAEMLARYALCLNLSLQVGPMLDLARTVRPVLEGMGDSRHHVHLLHHHVTSLIWNGRYVDAFTVRQDLSAMAERLGDIESATYAMVTELALSTYHRPLSPDAFAARCREAEAGLAQIDDAYLHNFYLAHVGWNAICRGQVAEARRAADRMIATGTTSNDPRALGYGTAMRALVAMLSADYPQALEMAEQALGVSRAEFERAIANAARHAALVPLKGPEAVAEVERYVALCEERGWGLFRSGPETMLAIALAMQGRIGEGMAFLERMIERHESLGRQWVADWCRLLLCELYLSIIASQGGASARTVLQNLRALSKAVFLGEKRIVAMIDKVRQNPQFDPDGHYIGTAELLLGLLFKARKKPARARQHLTEAHRIMRAFGQTPVLARVEAALADLGEAA